MNPAELYKLYSKHIKNYAYTFLKNEEDSKDALQEVFRIFLESAGKFRGESSIKTYLLVITRNYCLHKINKLYKRYTDDEILTNYYYEINPEDKISIEQAISILMPLDRELLYLKEYGGYSYEEMSKMTGLSLSNVKIRLFRLRQNLREFLK